MGPRPYPPIKLAFRPTPGRKGARRVGTARKPRAFDLTDGPSAIAKTGPMLAHVRGKGNASQDAPAVALRQTLWPMRHMRCFP
jgi:hypothetical protein